MFFNYPYTDLYSLNLDWIIKAIRELQDKIDEDRGERVLSFNTRTGVVTLQAADVNGLTINAVGISPDLSAVTPVEMTEAFEAGIRVLLEVSASGYQKAGFLVKTVDGVEMLPLTADVSELEDKVEEIDAKVNPEGAAPGDVLTVNDAGDTEWAAPDNSLVSLIAPIVTGNTHPAFAANDYFIYNSLLRQAVVDIAADAAITDSNSTLITVGGLSDVLNNSMSAFTQLDEQINPEGGGTPGTFLQVDSEGATVWGPPASAEAIGSAVTDWLDTNVPTGTTVVVDKSLTIADAAADSQVVGNELSDLKSAFDDLAKINFVNFFDGEFPESGYFDANGVDTSSSNYMRTSYISIDSAQSTLYVLRTAQPFLIGMCFYKANGEGYARTNIFGASSTDLTAAKEIPPDAVSMRMYVKVSDFTGNLMLSYTNQSEYVPYGENYSLKDGIVAESNLTEELKEKINSGLALSGKTIAFLGDSIIGNFYDTSGVCAIVAAKTGANVINCAFGGTRMAYRHAKHGDATPGATGYDEGATDAQKNAVDQYRYWNTLCGASLADAIASGVWTMQDDAVEHMASGLAYFSERLAQIKAVDWSAVDIVMWEYGTNDFMTEVALSGNDMFAYDYAYRHAIEVILTAYPRIKIIPVTPIYRWYQSGGEYTEDSNTYQAQDYLGMASKLTDFVAKAQSVSREYQLPCIDDYYTLGANRFNRLVFFNSTDGTHPNETGRKRIGEHISAVLAS